MPEANVPEIKIIYGAVLSAITHPTKIAFIQIHLLCWEE